MANFEGPQSDFSFMEELSNLSKRSKLKNKSSSKERSLMLKEVKKTKNFSNFVEELERSIKTKKINGSNHNIDMKPDYNTNESNEKELSTNNTESAITRDNLQDSVSGLEADPRIDQEGTVQNITYKAFLEMLGSNNIKDRIPEHIIKEMYKSLEGIKDPSRQKLIIAMLGEYGISEHDNDSNGISKAQQYFDLPGNLGLNAKKDAWCAAIINKLGKGLGIETIREYYSRNPKEFNKLMKEHYRGQNPSVVLAYTNVRSRNFGGESGTGHQVVKLYKDVYIAGNNLSDDGEADKVGITHISNSKKVIGYRLITDYKYGPFIKENDFTKIPDGAVVLLGRTKNTNN